MRIFNKMKKTMLVMMASLFCVGTTFAEVKTGVYAVAEGDMASGAQITSVEGITMTYGADDTWSSGSTEVTVGDYSFSVYASGQGNPKPGNGGIPTTGIYVSFNPQYTGTITAVVSNCGNNKSGYIVKDEENNLVNGVVTIDGVETEWNSGTPFNADAKYSGGVTFNVEAGSTYYFYLSGSKMRFQGFIYTYEASAPAYDLTAYNEAVAAAEAFKATLAADTYFEKEMIEELIVAIDEAIVFAQEGVDMAATQEDVDISTNMLNETVGMYKGNYDAQVLGFKIEEVRMAGQEALEKYPEETRVDNAGLVEALMNLPMRTMGYTVEQLQAAIDAVETAIPAFELENNQAILDAAKKKAADYVATLDISEETGTMAQMDAYNTLTYYTSDDFFAGDGKDITVDNYDMVMAYSQQIDMMIAQYEPQVQKDKSMMAATKAAAEAQETMASYENATDEAGLAAAIAKVNEILGELNMWDTMYTIEDLNAAVDALAAARVAFEKENGLEVGVAYYMKNVAAGKFLNGGNSWGTQASLLEHGFDVTLIEQEGGKYAIDTNVPNGAKRYLGSNGFVDSDLAAWTLTRVTGRIYTISLDGANFIGSDGSSVVNLALTDATDAAAQWQFITKDELVAGLADATVENPVDATFFIQGQNFNRADNNRNAAWQGSPTLGKGNDNNWCAEKWNCNFDVYQDLNGLPNGYYKVSVQGYYRAGNGGATSMEQNAKFYANSISTPLLNINTEAGNAAIAGNTSDVPGYGLVPNAMESAGDAFKAGLYADNSVIVEVTDGTLRIGVKKDVLIANDWTIFDNFELTYYGADQLPPVVADGTYYMKNVASGKFLNGGNSWGTQASLVDNGFDATLTYSNGTYTIDTNVPNGASLHFLGSNGYVDSDVANWKVVPAGENFAITLDGVNYIGYDGASSVMALNLTDAADAAAQWQFVTKEELVAALDGATEANPGNATFFIVGQNFNRGDANRNAAWQGSPAVGGINENHAGEKFNTNFDVYQELTGLPAGYYELSAQAYYRAGGNDVLVANKDSKNAVLYAGINSVPVMGILDEVGQEGMPNDVNIEGYGQVPNGMGTAAQAFTAGLYANNKVVALVTDGTLRVGIKKDVTIANDWTMFDNFQLAYLGTGVPSVFAPAVDSLNAAIADANAWKATLNAANEVEAQVIAQVEQGMLPAAQAVAAQPASIAQIEEMIANVNMFVAQTSMTLGQMKAAEAQAFLAEYEDPEYYTEEFTAAFNEVFNIANGLATGAYTWADLDAAIAKMNEAKETFVLQNVPAPTSEIVNVLGKHRLVALANDHVVATEIFYSFDEAMTEPAIYTAPFYVSETTTVYAYAQFIDEETRERFTSDVVAIEIEAGAEVALNAPVVEQVGKNIVITSDQSDVLNAPADTLEYAVYKKNAESGAYETAPYASGIYADTLAVNWASGDYKVVAKSVAFGYATAESAALEVEVRTVAYLCGADTIPTEAIYTALDNSGLYVTPLNYDNVSLTDADIETLAAYDLVVLAGNTGSGTNLAKTANLLVGKVNVLSTKSFWYKHYGTNGDNPGTADAPSRSLVKTVADHPIFAGIEGNEFEVFNDMGKENGRYLQQNGSFKEGLVQDTLALTNGAYCVGEGWSKGYGYVIIPVDGAQPAGYLTAAGETLFANAAWYLVEGEQYVASGDVTDNPFGIDATEAENNLWPADIYDINGRMVKKNATSLEGLQKGLYFIKGKKVLVK